MLYIHQYPDWTHFRYDSLRVLEALGKTRLAEGKLIGIRQVCGTFEQEQEMLLRDITANFEIDGHTATNAQAIKKIYTREWHSRSIMPLTTERLFDWFTALTQRNKPRLRENESEVVARTDAGELRFTGPNPERLQNEVANFIKWFETAPSDGIIKAALAHFWFLTLRPFPEANGRLARMLTAMQLTRAGESLRCNYTLNEQILKNRGEYFGILSKTQAGNGDLTEWILWFFKMVRNAIEESENAIESDMRKTAFKTDLSKPLRKREQVILDVLFAGSIPEKFTAKDVATFLGTSHDTALREIQSMMETGILQAEPKGGRSQRYSLKK